MATQIGQQQIVDRFILGLKAQTGPSGAHYVEFTVQHPTNPEGTIVMRAFNDDILDAFHQGRIRSNESWRLAIFERPAPKGGFYRNVERLVLRLEEEAPNSNNEASPRPQQTVADTRDRSIRRQSARRDAITLAVGGQIQFADIGPCLEWLDALVDDPTVSFNTPDWPAGEESAQAAHMQEIKGESRDEFQHGFPTPDEDYQEAP